MAVSAAPATEKNDHIREVAGRFAALGFTAITPELYHRTNGEALAYGDMDAVKPHAHPPLKAAARQALALTREFCGIAFGDPAA